MLLGCSTFWGCFRLLLGWTVCMHFYSIVVLFACISVLHAIRLITSFLYSSTACVLIYSVLALFCVHSSYDPALPLCASLLYSSIVCVHSYYVQAFSCMHFYFPLCAFMPYSGTVPRGKLSKSSTLWVHCSCLSCISITVPLHFYYISITFPLHFLCITFPLHFFSSTSCVY